MTKHHRKVGQMKILKPWTMDHLCYNFALVLHENALVIIQSEEHNFSMYIIRDVTVCMDSTWLSFLSWNQLLHNDALNQYSCPEK